MKKTTILDQVVLSLLLSYIILRADIPSFFTAKVTNILLLKPRKVILKAPLIFEHFPLFLLKKFNTSAVVHQKYFNSICALFILIIC